MKSEKLPLEISFILLLCSGVTIIFSPSSFDSFVFPKFILLLVTGAWCLGLLVSCGPEIKRFRAFTLILFFFAIWFTFLLIRGEVFHTSLFGVQGRNMGYLSYLSLLVVSLLFCVKSSEIVLRRTILTFTFASSLVVLYGGLQILSMDPIEWSLVYQGIIGNLGNPNFMSVVCALAGTCLFFWVFQDGVTKPLKGISLVGLLLAGIGVHNTKATQGWIVLAIGVTPLIYLFIERLGKLLAKVFALSIAVSATFVSLAIFNVGPLAGLIYQQSLAYRADFWSIAWRMATSNPFFGVGIDRFQNYYREYRTLSQTQGVSTEDFSDSAHNLYLHLAATGGFPLAIIALAINIFVAFRFYVALKKASEMQRYVALIFGIWLGIQAQNLISIDYPSIALWSWIFSGIGVGLSCSEKNVKAVKTESLGLKYAGFFVSIAFTTSAVVILSPAASAQSQLRIGFYAYVEKGNQEAIKIKDEYLQNVERKEPRNPTLPLLTSNSLFQDGAFTEAANAARRAIKIDDHDYRTWWFLASSLEKLDKRPEAIQARKKTVELSPFNVSNLLELAKDQLSAGDIRGARVTREQIAKLNVNSSELAEIDELLKK